MFNVENEKCSINVTLKGETQKIPLKYITIGDTKINFNGAMGLESWDAMEAIKAINKAYEVLCTGKDGISKTWSKVALKAEVMLKKQI